MSKARVICDHDNFADAKCEIELYINCRLCLKEMPAGESPAHWARINVGVTGKGQLQVWCVRHDINVDLMTFEVK